MKELMNEELIFSIILPVYNVQAYLKEALSCLAEQTYGNFEALIVDDCATDASGEIADAFIKESGDGRFRVIHLEKNGGVSRARNAGMKEATGEYILFLDPDDTYEKTLLETLARAAEEYPWDIMLFGYTEDYYRTEGTLSYQVKKSLPSERFRAMEKKPEAFCDTILKLEQETMYGYPWNKAYRLEYLRKHQVSFPVITHIEDILFNIAAFEEISSFALLPETLYHYRNQGQVRLTGKYLPQYFSLQKQRISAFLEQQSRWRKNGADQLARLPEAVLGEAANFYFRAFQSSMVRGIAHGESKKQVLEAARRETEEPLYELLRTHLRDEGRVAKLLYRPLAEGRVASAYRRSLLIDQVQRHFPGLYARLKQNR